MNFIKNSWMGFLLSGSLILISFVLFSYSYIQTGSILKYGIDFTGGTLLELETHGEDSGEKFLTYFQDKEHLSPVISETDNNTHIVKMKDITEEEHVFIITELKSLYPKLEEKRFLVIGPAVGKTMKQKAYTALIIALISIVLYIAYAFSEVQKIFSSWKFGFSAIVALMHDVIITVGIFSFLGMAYGVEVDALFITALLTLMGFSVHDTIVVFDRLRENTKNARSKDDMENIANASVQQTLMRSINTSISTLFPLVALFFLGAESIQMFIFALIIGIVVGTYSSIFLAIPILIKWHDE
ncbi:protein translocase subunit SecF [Candidatus Peregrinibacteria bacterium]|nr:MAG: protein translocase subunit SecF [Candidatus Peregrinibacteria bacterium]